MNELEHAIRTLGPWFHQIDLKGCKTRDISPHSSPAPENHPAWRWDIIRPLLPASLDGLSVLDAGCSDGYFAFRLAEEGAARVLGLERDPAALARAEFARRVLAADKVRFAPADVTGPVAEITREGPFDVTLFLAVLHQLRDPYAALKNLFALSETLILETSALADRHHSLMYWGPDTRITHDGIAGWLPTAKAVERMLAGAGFVDVREEETGEEVEFVDEETIVPALRKHLYRPLFVARRPPQSEQEA